ncbi:unnamed protein product (macronuclear) [Paramecium tetraurelia]|uniref:Chromosome undetermined scaffold_1, whole genome shotgun sequence n=1 Tax=Paramecium tetraurelia TaxID=5888 RepID=Q6BFY2_PARTE|nr:hypothetical protein [Paramecium tetraurelia strain d4-2]XP_001423239.1 uncharacterized protein GSPATT00000276001 [Paramecium tetraurelia]CAH03438.1 hypothetical protein PTMB.240 [Paramecium tetraurelia]CAK55841.1 unnamed protein product [Paramecium tetraurelia]|eukprot:XP_001423239.1 hypothetical protein (macronuclear) [Paramecium tetraurelia strain d4-2]
MNFLFPKIQTRPINLLESQCQSALKEISSSEQRLQKYASKKISNKHSFSDKSCLHQFRRVSQVINDPSPDVKQFPDVKKKNMSVCVNPRIEKYKIHLDMIENQNPIQIPHLSIKAPQKYPPILSSKILPSTKRYKTDISEGTQIYKISNHFTIQSVRDKQQKLVKNIQSLIEHVNSSRDEKLCKLFDKLKHDLDLDDIKLENE